MTFIYKDYKLKISSETDIAEFIQGNNEEFSGKTLTF